MIKSPNLVHIIKKSLSLLDSSTKKKYLLVSMLQILLSLLDLLSVALVGVIGALSVRGVQSQPPGNRTEAVLKFLKLDGFSFQSQVMFLALGTVLLLVIKTVFSITITKRTLRFLAHRSSGITRELVRNVLQQPLSRVYARGAHELHYVLGPGVNGVVLGILGVAATVIADASLLVVLGVGLAVLSPSIALTSLVFFGAVALILHLIIRKHAITTGQVILDSEVKSGRLISEALDLYRELYVRNRRLDYANAISHVRYNSAVAQADQTFLPNISKYVLEISVIAGSVAIAGIQFITQTATVALAGLGLFIVAGGRIAPALMRLQQGVMNIESRAASLDATLETIRVFESFDRGVENNAWPNITHSGFEPSVQIRNLSFGFDDTDIFLRNIDLNIPSGLTVAIVGPSGSGKTTLINLILGLLEPTKGEVLISGREPLAAITEWTGGIAYVPQEVKLISGTFRENIELGTLYPSKKNEILLTALEKSNLIDLVSQLPEGLETFIGQSGYQLSGGQKQRLGLARAFYTNPKLIILDEATSALDSATEDDITKALESLRGEVTLIVIAHRLSTVRNADCVIYLNQGEIIARGTFDEVRQKVPDFDRQANLMGL
jgi:ABC-type multidrug transport system fused ATPase/permease subunit